MSRGMNSGVEERAGAWRRWLVRAAVGLGIGAAVVLGTPGAVAGPDTGAGAQPAAPTADKAAERGEDRWYLVMLQGRRAGTMHETVEATPAGLVSKTELAVEIKRMETPVRVRCAMEFVETAAGAPVRMSSVVEMGAAPATTSYLFTASGVEVTSGEGPGARSRTARLPKGAWMTPTAASRHIEKEIAAGKTEIEVRTVEPSSGLEPATTRMKLIERTTLGVVGKTVPALKWSTTNDLVPNAETVEFTDERGRTLRTEMDLGGLKLVVMLADAQVAGLKVDPPELLASTLIVPDKPVRRARETRVAEYRLAGPRAALEAIPSGGVQRVERGGEGAVGVSVDVGRPSLAPAADAGEAAYTAASAMIESDDARVKGLVGEALGAGAPAGRAARAEALRRFAHGYITKKTLDVGFATAAEVARTRQGDCTEHAVLLCGLLRADGTPSRVVSGLVYVDGLKDGHGAFGYHMWTQALLEVDGAKRWVDLDATLSGERAFDAAHIALKADALADGKNALVEMAPTIGALKISVEKAE